MLKTIAFLVLGALILGVFVWTEEQFAPSLHQCIDEWATNHGNPGPDKNGFNSAILIEGYSICTIRAIDHHNGFFAAIASFIIAWFTVVLAGVGRRQIEDIRILQRAYIAVKPAGINPFVSENSIVADQIVGHVAFVNVGRLPARNISVDRAIMKWDKSGELDESAFPVAKASPMTIVLSPGTKMRHGTNSLLASELEKPGFVYVYGRVDYTDGFNVHRHTRFCHRYPCIRHKSTAEGKRIGAKHARQHRHGNDAD